MANKDPLFAAKFKSAWDQYFKKNPRLILILCGSVSTWIENNLLNNTSFEGRISYTLPLQELKLQEINQFWIEHNYHMSSLEKMLVLSVTGGVPKYLEEVLSNEKADENIVRLCFSSTGLLFNEYDTIFSSIFNRQKHSLEKIVRACLEKKLSTSQIARKLNKSLDGHLSNLIHILEISGFISKDYYFKFDGTVSTLNHIRVKDNYLRFYLKYIEPNKARILKGGKIIKSLNDLTGFESILGYQFENILLANRESIHVKLNILESSIISSAPYAQRRNKQNKQGCQVDLLIHTDLDVFFLCEFKCKKIIEKSVVKQVEKKMKALKLPKRAALKPVLIYEGDIHPPDFETIHNFFFKVIHFADMLVLV